MESVEKQIKNIIITKYGSLKKFCETIDMPWTTLDSILKRGFANSNITNVLKITRELNVNAEALAFGKIERDEPEVHTIAAHHDDEEWTEEELDEIEEFKKYVLSKRKK